MSGVCKTCGVPRLLSMTQAWRDGCIVDSTSRSASLCIYGASYPTALISELESQLGIPLDRIVYLAGTHAAVKVLGVLYESHPLVGRMLFSAPLHRMTERVLINYGKAIGVANVDIIERRRGNGARVRISDPFDLSNCLAIISGILQIADGSQIAYEILNGKDRGNIAGAGDVPAESAGEGGDSYLVGFSPASAQAGEEEAYQRLFAENLSPRKTGGERLARCKRCGAPREVGAGHSFDAASGLIRERTSGERVIFMGVHGFNTIIRELTWELGNVVSESFIAFERERLREKLAREDAGAGEDAELLREDTLRDYFSLRGLGYLSDLRETDGRIQFSVENAFIAPLVAGRLLAFWDRERGEAGSYEYDVTEDTLRLSIR